MKDPESAASSSLASKTIVVVLPEDSAGSNGRDRLFLISYNEMFRVLQEAGYALELIYFKMESDSFEALIKSCQVKHVRGISIAMGIPTFYT